MTLILVSAITHSTFCFDFGLSVLSKKCLKFPQRQPLQWGQVPSRITECCAGLHICIQGETKNTPSTSQVKLEHVNILQAEIVKNV